MSIVIGIVVLVIAIWIDWLIAQEFYNAAILKGYPDTKYMWICFFLGVVGYLLVIALPDRENTGNVLTNELPDL